MAVTGFIDNFDMKSRDERAIHLTDLPPLKMNRRYKKKYPIKRLAWVQQSNYPKKVIALEEIEFESGSELRLRYYIIGKKPGMRGKWTYGESAPLIPEPDFSALVEEAKRNGLVR